MGNGEAKELICMTHGHELRWGEYGCEVGCRAEGTNGGKWDNCNSVINKYVKNGGLGRLTRKLIEPVSDRAMSQIQAG